MRRIGLEPDEVRERLEASGGRGRARGSGGGRAEEPAHTSHAKRLIEAASKEARESGSEISAEHLLLAALHEPRGAMARILSDAGISPAKVRDELDRTPAAKAPVRTPAEPARPPRERESRGAHPGLPPHLQKTPTPRWRLVLLLAVPVSIALAYVFHAPPVWVFITACIGVLPLAAFMGEATEHLAHRTSPTVGGLLNATFGNAAELIIALMALRAGLVDLVKASITGSILGNLLLIMGLALVAGGLNRPELRFNRTTAGMSAGMLALSVVALTFPALYHAVHPEAAARAAELHMSEAVAVILILTYGCSLLFTLRTHRRLLGGEAHPVEGPVWGMPKALAILGGATVGVAVESELLVHAASEATEALGRLADIPGPHHHSHHRQCRGACGRRGPRPEGADRSRTPDRAGLEHPGGAPGRAGAGVRGGAHGHGHESGLPALRGGGIGNGDGGHRYHHTGRGIALVRGGPTPRGVPHGGGGRILPVN